MELIKSSLPEVILIKPTVFSDSRGFFLESYKKSVFIAQGINEEFLQDNHSKSAKGVLRGLHYQLDPYAQGKLVRVIRGKIFDVAVDIRVNSITFGQWVSYELSASNQLMVYIPQGFAHGFLTLEDDTEILYKTTNEYQPTLERGIAYDDPQIAIVWPKIDSPVILSTKDQQQPSLANSFNQ